MDKRRTAKWSIKNRDVEASGLTKWGSSDPEDVNSPPAATLFYEYLTLLPERPDLSPVIIMLARSAIKKARKGLNDKIMTHGQHGRPMQALAFVARVVGDVNNDGQKFFNWKFTGAGFATEPQYAEAMRLNEVIGNYVVDEKSYKEDNFDEDDGAKKEEAF